MPDRCSKRPRPGIPDGAEGEGRCARRGSYERWRLGHGVVLSLVGAAGEVRGSTSAVAPGQRWPWELLWGRR